VRTTRSIPWLAISAMVVFACGGGGSGGASPTQDSGAGADAAPEDSSVAGDDAGMTANDGSALADTGSSGKDAPSSGGSPYDTDGPQAYTTSIVQLSNAGRSWQEAIYTPTSPGLHPVVSINCGTQQVNAAYAPYAKRLASYGILTLVQDDEGALAPTPNVVDDLVYVMTTYVPMSLASSADMKHVGLSGHSRGGKATLLAAENALKGKVVAWFGLDPIDVDFLGTPGALPNIGTIGIPLGFAGATVSSNCSPASANYEVYYASASPPAVAVTIENSGHMQFLDESKGVAVSYCTPEGTADSATVLSTAVHYMTAFFARELLGDASVGAAFGGAGAPADIASGTIKVESK
jgi:hypothetical protein